MGVPTNSFEGVFDYKLDAKFRVSVPSEWRPGRGEARQRTAQAVKSGKVQHGDIRRPAPPKSGS